jgi:fructoselysine 6-phosphate deglycase
MSLPSAFDAGVVAALSALDAKSVKHVFFVACGGSLSIMHPAKFLLEHPYPLPSGV